jgi:hypothetical protein
MIGPILLFRGIATERCRLVALLVTPEGEVPPPLIVDKDNCSQPEALCDRAGKMLWCYEFSVPLNAPKNEVSYRIGSQQWSITLPARHQPLRIAFTSCNGSEDEPFSLDDPHRNAVWGQLAKVHAQSPFHLLLQGGDQIYADMVWKEIEPLKAWQRQPRRKRLHTSMTPEAIEAIATFYFERYCRIWSQPELAPVLASIPSLMMWDDHDIFDGWGSWPPALQACPVYQSLWKSARDHFALFQQGSRPDQSPTGIGDPDGRHFGWAFKLGTIGIIAPDLRSNRTRRRMMDDVSWRWFETALTNLADCRHVLVVSTVPVANIDLSWIERILFWLPRQSYFQDDLRDQWQSYAHREEWRRLLQVLFDFSAQHQIRLSILSGEIHLAALGLLQRGDICIHQLTSSGIVHPPPSPLVAWLYDRYGRQPKQVTQNIDMRMCPLPGLGRRYVAARNWLSIQCNPSDELDVKWHVEDWPEPLAMSIPPLSHTTAV